VPYTCKCFLKSGLPEKSEYDSETEAKKEALKMTEQMNNTFCHKHEFVLTEQFGDFTITMRAR
jgi:hypothetical protein